MDKAKAKLPSVMDPGELSLGEVYAQALLDTLPEVPAAQEIADELEGIVSILAQNPQAGTLVTGAMLKRQERSDILRRIFSGRVSQKTEAFLSVLDSHDRINILPAAAREFRKRLNKKMGLLEVTVTTAVALEESQRQAVSDELCATLQVKAVVESRVDENILGGAVLRIGDRVFDASLLAQLKSMKEAIAAGRGLVKKQ